MINRRLIPNFKYETKRILLTQTKELFIMKNDTIGKQLNPNLIPEVTLYTGNRIPCIGFGTFGSDSVTAETLVKIGKFS